MKVTALIPDALIREAQRLTGAKTITESITRVLQEWIRIKNLRALNEKIDEKPLRFAEGYNAKSVRAINRRTRN